MRLARAICAISIPLCLAAGVPTITRADQCDPFEKSTADTERVFRDPQGKLSPRLSFSKLYLMPNDIPEIEPSVGEDFAIRRQTGLNAPDDGSTLTQDYEHFRKRIKNLRTSRANR